MVSRESFQAAAAFTTLPRARRKMMFYVYVLSSRSGRLCAGITKQIERHLEKHQKALAPQCTHKHQFDRLLLLEPFRLSAEAAARERQINDCTLTQKLELIRETNPKFEDLALTMQPQA